MKKVFSYLLGLVVVFGMAACSSDSSTKEVATASTGASDAAETAAPAANPADNKPDYIRRAEELPRTSVNFASEEFDFGQVNAGEKVFHKFTFTNTGSEDLVITYIRTSCGCTTPEWSEEPVKPGEDGYVDVEFDSTGKKDTQIKNITLFGNFEGQTNRVVKLRGEVLSE